MASNRAGVGVGTGVGHKLQFRYHLGRDVGSEFEPSVSDTQITVTKTDVKVLTSFNEIPSNLADSKKELIIPGMSPRCFVPPSLVFKAFKFGEYL